MKKAESRKFVIDRATWRCGDKGKYQHGRLPTLLLGSDGMMCCLGHCAIQLGATPEDIDDVGEPSDIPFGKLSAFSKATPELNSDCIIAVATTSDLDNESGEYLTSELGNEAITINDDMNITREERESKLTALFARHGHELTFTGDYTHPPEIAAA